MRDNDRHERHEAEMCVRREQCDGQQERHWMMDVLTDMME